jgi:predicted metal-dependent phosphoesterase TrpH
MLLPEYVGEGEAAAVPKNLTPITATRCLKKLPALIVMHQQGSTSLIQRKMKLGYNRAGRIIDQLEAAGIVGPFEGSKARENISSAFAQKDVDAKKILNQVSAKYRSYNVVKADFTFTYEDKQASTKDSQSGTLTIIIKNQ